MTVHSSVVPVNDMNMMPKTMIAAGMMKARKMFCQPFNLRISAVPALFRISGVVRKVKRPIGPAAKDMDIVRNVVPANLIWELMRRNVVIARIPAMITIREQRYLFNRKSFPLPVSEVFLPAAPLKKTVCRWEELTLPILILGCGAPDVVMGILRLLILCLTARRILTFTRRGLKRFILVAGQMNIWQRLYVKAEPARGVFVFRTGQH